MMLLIAAFMTVSCEKDPSSLKGNSSDEESSINEKLVGDWSIYRYEAINKGGTVYKSVSDPSAITASFWKFGFTKEGMMTVVSGTEANSSTFPYYYYSKSKTVKFNASGVLYLVELTDEKLVFESEFFAPEESWYDDAMINSIRVYCSR